MEGFGIIGLRPPDRPFSMKQKRVPSGLALRLSTVLTVFPLHGTPRPFTSAFPLRAPL